MFLTSPSGCCSILLISIKAWKWLELSANPPLKPPFWKRSWPTNTGPSHSIRTAALFVPLEWACKAIPLFGVILTFLSNCDWPLTSKVENEAGWPVWAKEPVTAIIDAISASLDEISLDKVVLGIVFTVTELLCCSEIVTEGFVCSVIVTFISAILLGSYIFNNSYGSSK